MSTTSNIPSVWKFNWISYSISLLGLLISTLVFGYYTDNMETSVDHAFYTFSGINIALMSGGFTYEARQ